MPEDRFWAIIDATTMFESDRARQLAALSNALAELPFDDIEAYQATFDQIMKRAYSWDLWGAACVVNGGEGDDGFDYFRCWLISRGRRMFEEVLSDPESLADICATDLRSGIHFEGFSYVAKDVWREKTGRKAAEMQTNAWMSYQGVKPSGAEFQEGPQYLARRYPKLWQRFGENPLQGTL